MKRPNIPTTKLRGFPRDLYIAMVNLQTPKEAEKFLRDLLTEQEIMEFACRWRAARLLSEGVPYSEVSAITGLSSTTIARVSKWLKVGKGGYRLMINRFNSHNHPAARGDDS